MNATSDPTTPRPLQWLRGYSEEFPGVWKLAKKMRSERGEELPYWPEWCYLPVSGGFAIASAYTDDLPEQARQASIFSALAAWRMTKGIYRFDSDILDAVWDTPTEGEIPAEILFRLPEWCCYVETPGKTLSLGEGGDERPLSGFFVYLEHDIASAERGMQRRELRFVLDLDAKAGKEEEGLLYPIPMHLTKPTLGECLEETAKESATNARATYGEDLYPADSLVPLLGGIIPPLLSTTLYLCSVAEIRAEDGSDRSPANPTPKKTRKSKDKLFAARELTTWEVAYRLGAALRAALASAGEPPPVGGLGAPRRGHIRRAHWHTYWTGPRSGPQTPVLKWLPPIPVNLEDVEELPATIRPVK